jgi:hypothetical protein
MTLLKEYGLPLAMLAAGGWLTVTGKVVPGPTHEDVKKQRDRALDEVYKLAQGIKNAVAIEEPQERKRPPRGRGRSDV